ncbi:MAG: ribosome biogenesis GTPase Der [Deferribacteres bacterium]|nr:ribosome biogenesis GTPase Der [Deferribacteres bacterium]
MKRLPKIAIVGRPNVGKSSLFNAWIRKRKAIVAPEPGVTVDRIEEEVELNGKRAVLIDTGGVTEREGVIEDGIRSQVRRAIDEADVILFVVDAKEGIHPLDELVANMLRDVKKPVFLVVNKVDNERIEAVAYEFYRLGIEPVFFISVAQRQGLGELIEKVFSVLPEALEEPQQDEVCRISVVGRPNVGKSSIINRIIGDERTLVSEIPGTTKDAVDVELETPEGKVVLIDTAGLRRKSRVSSKLEAYSISRTTNSIKRSDVAILVLNATEGVTEQDKKIAGLVMKEKKGIVVAINKIDLFEGDLNELMKDARLELYFLPEDAPFIFTSAVTGKGINRLVREALEVQKLRKVRVKTSLVNRAIEEIVSRHHPPSVGGRYIKIYYGTQVDVEPPQFVVFSNYPEEIPEHYKRYFEKALSKSLGFSKVPIEVMWRKRE